MSLFWLSADINSRGFQITLTLVFFMYMESNVQYGQGRKQEMAQGRV